jgi:hypothetical protein
MGVEGRVREIKKGRETEMGRTAAVLESLHPAILHQIRLPSTATLHNI